MMLWWPASTSWGPKIGRWPVGLDLEAAVEALVCAEVVGPDLMADRAGYAVHRERIRRLRGERREDLALAAAMSVREAHHRHVTGRALVLDRGLRRRMIKTLASHGGMPVRIPRGVGHHRCAPAVADRDIVARRRCDVAMAGDAVCRRYEKLGRGCRIRRLRAQSAGKTEAGEPGEAAPSRYTRLHYHPSVRPPSNQSQST
jgi:hypothetical protein